MVNLFFWDEHGYFVKSSRPYVQTPLYKGKGATVEMDRDICSKPKVPEFWEGQIKAGIFFCDDVSAVRQDWVREGLLPRCNVRGYNKFNSITRSTPDGDCTVKQTPQFSPTYAR